MLAAKKVEFTCGLASLFLQISMLLCEEHTAKKFGHFSAIFLKTLQKISAAVSSGR
jgi:hypothetical protein